MDDEALKTEIEARIRSGLQPIVQEQRRLLDSSDEEYREYLRGIEGVPEPIAPSSTRPPPRFFEGFLSKPSTVDLVVKSRLGPIFRLIKEMRLESGISGPLTEEEYLRAAELEWELQSEDVREATLSA